MSTSACASPIVHSTSWWVSALFSTRSARVLGGEPGQRRRQLVLVGLALGHDRDRQQRLGHRPRPQHPRLLDRGQGVAGLGAAELADRAEVAGDHARRPARGGGRTGRTSEPTFSSSSWSSWPDSAPKNDVKWPDTCTGASGSSVPEKTRTRLTRPTYWSLVVLTTSATSGPSRVARRSRRRPRRPGVKTSGEGCSSGDGKPRTSEVEQLGAARRRSTEQTGTTG